MVNYVEFRRGILFIGFRGSIGSHPPSKKMQSGLFLAAKELSQTDRKFIVFYRMSHFREFLQKVYSCTALHGSPLLLQLSRLIPGLYVEIQNNWTISRR